MSYRIRNKIVPRRPVYHRPEKAQDHAKLQKIRHVALDMDGTIYQGKKIFPFTLPFLQLLEERGVGCTFLTNNSSKSVRTYQKKLQEMGISARLDQFYTSTQATMDYLREEMPHLKKWFVLGTPDMKEELKEGGFKTVDEMTGEPEGVIVGYDPTLDYPRLCRAAYWIQKGKPYLATNPDRFCPTDEPTWLVDCGALCSAIEASTGRKPDRVIGKPDPYMIQKLLVRHGIEKKAMAMVGDRLYTDMEMARAAGIIGVLVLTGDSSREEAARAVHRPDFVCEDLGELGDALRTA